MRTLPNHVLYILMRSDMESMNSGKAIAQGSHASNAFVHQVRNSPKETMEDNHKHYISAVNWQRETVQGFGTVLVLEVDEKQMRGVNEAFNELGYFADVVNDPTYPLVDGKVVHFLDIDTCAYVFVPNKADDTIAPMILGRFGLHP